MSWASELANGIGSVFGYDTAGDQLGDYITNLGSADTGTVSAGSTGAESSFWDSKTFGTLLESGLGLAGIYFQQSQQKKLAEEAAKQRMAELEAAAKLKGGGGGGGGGGARLAALTSLYNNYANLVQQGGEAVMNGAIKTGDAATAPIIARIQALR